MTQPPQQSAADRDSDMTRSEPVEVSLQSDTPLPVSSTIAANGSSAAQPSADASSVVDPLRPTSARVEPLSDRVIVDVGEELDVADLEASAIVISPVDSANPPRSKGVPLKWQLLAVVLPALLIPLAIVGIAYTQVVHQTAEEQQKDRLARHTQLAGDIAIDVLDGQRQIVTNLANNPIVIEAARLGSDRVTSDGLTDLPIDLLEAQFSASRTLGVNSSLDDYLGAIAARSSVAELFFTERNGLNVASSVTTSDFVQWDERWWQVSQEQGSWLGSPHFDRSSQQYGFDIGHAIVDKSSGEFLGVIKAFISVDAFRSASSYMTGAGQFPSERLQVLDVSSGKPVVGLSENGTINLVTVTGGHDIGRIASLVANSTPTELPLALKEQFLVSELEIFQLDRGGDAGSEARAETELTMVSFVLDGRFYTMASLPNTSFVSISSISAEVLEQAGRGVEKLLALLGLSLGAIAVIACWLGADYLTTPLRRLAMIAQQAASGNLDIRAAVGGAQESRTLAASFNNLITRVTNLLDEQAETSERVLKLASISGARTETEEDIANLLSLAVDITREQIDAERVVIYRFRQDGSGYISAEAAIAGIPSALDQPVGDACIPEEIRQAYSNGRTLTNVDVMNAGFHPDHVDLMERLAIKSNAIVPILAGGDLFGLLIAHYCHWQHQWTSDEVDALQEIAERLTLALNRVAYVEKADYRTRQERRQKELLQRRALELLMEVDPVSQGDLTVRVNVTEDEIGTIADSYNSTVSSLRKIVEQVQSSASEVFSATTTSESSVKALTADAMRQARDIEAALARLQSLATSIDTVAAKTTELETSVRVAAQTVVEGDAAMNRTVEGMESIRETVAQTAKKVKRLGEASQRISQVVNLIDSFAEQTNLLALNASIEAAHAGEHGRGFAQVADEVRALARQSAAAAADIGKLVADIQSETNEAISAMETGTEQVVTGTQLVGNARSSLTQIAETSEKLFQSIDTIAQTSLEQASTSETVTTTMERVALTATHTADTAADVSESVAKLLEVAQALQSSVSQFKIR